MILNGEAQNMLCIYIFNLQEMQPLEKIVAYSNQRPFLAEMKSPPFICFSKLEWSTTPFKGVIRRVHEVWSRLSSSGEGCEITLLF